MVKTAVIGASGFVGQHLLATYRKSYSNCIGTSFSSSSPHLIPYDLRHSRFSQLGLEDEGYQAVIIASAKPNIAYCETCKTEAYEVNVRGTLNQIEQIGKTSMQVIFFSTDYVFDGRDGLYDDGASTAPSTEYGRQKALVEKEIPSLTDNYLILRLSKIYGTRKGDGTLLDEFAKSFAEKRIVRAARDQFFSPTFVDDLVLAVLSLQQLGKRGLFNVCSPERWSRLAIAEQVAEIMGVCSRLIEPISLYEIPSMVGRPLDTSMRCSRLRNETKIMFSPLQNNIADYFRYSGE